LCNIFAPEIDLSQYQLTAKSLDYIGGNTQVQFFRISELIMVVIATFLLEKTFHKHQPFWVGV
jgi:hypothetical protein